ncbi:peptidoglycan DD-metalloendopeptidase family protein [Micromonospora sp. NPDC003197]
MTRLRRWTSVAVAAMVGGGVLAWPAAGQAVPGTGVVGVTEAVALKLVEKESLAAARSVHAEDVRVTVARATGSWAFGTAVAVTGHEADAHPVGAVFLARNVGGTWRTAFDGEAGFSTLAAESPLVTEQEKNVFTTSPGVTYANGDYRTGMAMPFAVGQTWRLTGGPHGWGGAAPFSSIDLAGGDEVVRAARAGTAYTMCQGWVRVIHDRGYSTDYYHLWSNISANGTAVAQGAYLGYTGTDVTCGGSATGRHVHFGLRQNSAYVPIAGHDLGKWVINSGAAAYQGGARHGSTSIGIGGSIYNYGALGFTQGVVDANGGGTLTKRSGPGTGYGAIGSLSDGATVTISCSANGTSHTGRYGTTALWNRLSDGSWVSDAYLWTGVNGTVNGYC